jgi:hypothetical protein
MSEHHVRALFQAQTGATCRSFKWWRGKGLSRTGRAHLPQPRPILGLLIGASSLVMLALPSSPTDTTPRGPTIVQPFAIVAIPEPSMFALFGLGFCALALWLRSPGKTC